VERMLRGEDSFAVGGTNFQWRDLDNHGWQQLPPDIPALAF
jgi:hypothetical protein